MKGLREWNVFSIREVLLEIDLYRSHTTQFQASHFKALTLPGSIGWVALKACSDVFAFLLQELIWEVF